MSFKQTIGVWTSYSHTYFSIDSRPPSKIRGRVEMYRFESAILIRWTNGNNKSSKFCPFLTEAPYHKVIHVRKVNLSAGLSEVVVKNRYFLVMLLLLFFFSKKLPQFQIFCS